MKRPAGFIIDVPLTLTVAVRGAATEKDAKRLAREFAESLSPTEHYIKGYNEGLGLIDGAGITEVSLESSMEDPCEVFEELEAEDESD